MTTERYAHEIAPEPDWDWETKVPLEVFIQNHLTRAWACPDDVMACADFPRAVRAAMHINLSTYPLLTRDDWKYAPMSWAVPLVWPHSPESHAEDLAAQEAEDPRWSGPNDDLAPLAAEVFGSGQ